MVLKNLFVCLCVMVELETLRLIFDFRKGSVILIGPFARMSWVVQGRSAKLGTEGKEWRCLVVLCLHSSEP